MKLYLVQYAKTESEFEETGTLERHIITDSLDRLHNLIDRNCDRLYFNVKTVDLEIDPVLFRKYNKRSNM